METTIPFQGFYDSIHSETLDYALASIFSDSRGETIDSLYSRASDKADWKKVHIEYAQAYTEFFADLFGLKTLKFKELSSPKFYNFETDRIFCDIDLEEVKQMFRSIKLDNLFIKIQERFTSCSGFISHYSNKLSEWPQDLEEWDHNQIGTLLETYIESHEEYIQDWESSLITDLSETAYAIVSENINDERLFKIGDYLREREERQWRKQA